MGTLETGLGFALGGDLLSSAYARMLAGLLPPGRAWRLISGSVLLQLLDGCADELDRLDQRARDLIDEAYPATANELLAEHERELGLASDGTDEERQARVVARVLARQRYRPVDFRTALAPLLGQAADDVVVVERSRADAVAMADDREIFRFFIYRDPTEPGDYYLDSAQELVDMIKPSHTVGHVIESIDMLCDDEFSLCDRDILGA